MSPKVFFDKQATRDEISSFITYEGWNLILCLRHPASTDNTCLGERPDEERES